MTKSFSKNHQITLFAVILICCLIASLFAVMNNTIINTQAEVEFDVEKEIKFAQIADTHYYPLRYNHNIAEEGEYYRMMLGDAKILIESSTVYKTLLDDIYDKAEDLEFIIVAGDLTKDSELASHLDMANSLRSLQNRIREDYAKPDFQIFTIIGNHDIYKEEDCFSFAGDGVQKEARSVSRKDISIIYAGLGYPNMTYDEVIADTYIQDLMIEDGVDENTYLPYVYDTVRDTSYIESFNSTSFDYTYLYEEKYTTSPDDYLKGELSYIAISNKEGLPASILAIETEGSVADHNVTGGGVTLETMNFFGEQTANVPDEHTMLATLHRNMIPQFSMQAGILADFVVDDWKNVADFFADLGVRYVFTGHMHANTINNHISFNNNQITDIEVAGATSYCGGTRYFTLEKGMYGENYAENLKTEFSILEEIDFTYLFENNYITQDYLDRNNLNDYIDGYMCTDFSLYARTRIYDNMVDNMLNKYLSEEFINESLDSVSEIIPDSISIMNLKNIKGMVDKLLINLIKEVEDKVLTGYQYQGSNPEFTGGDNLLLAYLDDLTGRIKTLEVTEAGNTILEVFFACYLPHLDGTNYYTYDELPDFVKEGLVNLRSGEVVDDLLDIVLNEQDGLYRVIRGLLTEELNLTEGLSTKEVGYLNTIGIILGIEGFEPTKIKVEELIDGVRNIVDIDLLPADKSVIDFLDETIESYVTESLKTGLGDIAADILESFAIDPITNIDYEGTLHIKVDEGDMFSYLDVPRVDNPTIENGKLPSKITVTFGEDPTSDKNLNWMTDKRVDSSSIEYSINQDMSNSTIVNGEFTIYALKYPLIDIGLFATYRDTEIGRHTVSLQGLDAGTKYYYRVGSQAMSYWSSVYSMTTAPDDNQAFDMLLIADAQGYTQNSYNEVFEVLNNIDSVFSNGYDFIASVGDDVDNSRNSLHYNYFLDTDQAFWANTSYVVTAGNHEKYYYESDSGFVASSEEVYQEPYNYQSLYYNLSIPSSQQGLTGAYYSFDYSGVHFTVLNTNDIDDNDLLGATQLAWLENDLRSSDKAHKVIIMHKGLYTSGSHSYDSEVIAMRAQLQPIFYNNGVNLVLGGHDHTYSETYYLDAEGNRIKSSKNKDSKIASDGVLYVTLGTIGNKFYNWQDNEEIPLYYGEELHDSTLSNPVFGKLTFDGTDLYYEAYQYDLATGEITLLEPQGTSAALIISIVIACLLVVGGLGIGIYTLKFKA